MPYGLRIQGIQDSQACHDRVPLKAIAVEVTIKWFVANVQSTLTYKNQQDVAVETVFVFPIDDQSAVYHFEADIDVRHIIAECQDKTQARETYTDALATGHAAMLLSEMDTAGDTFECKLGNLLPHKSTILKFSYVTDLAVDSAGVVTFTLPTVLNPRYSPTDFAGPKLSSDSVQYADIPYQMKFETRVEGQHMIKRITSKKDTMVVDISGDKMAANVTLADASKLKFDHDLSLTLEYEDVFQPTIILEKGKQDQEGFLKSDVVMVDFLPDLRSVPELTEVEFVFVIDCSGSMRGDRIAKAKETVLLLLKSLPVGCSFNMVTFGSSFKWLFSSAKNYDEESLKNALTFHQTLDANMGGTEILQPLESMYAQKSNAFRQVFLMTDGEVSNTNAVISLARKNVLTSRIFTFGIGSGASTSLISNVAKVTNGQATFVRDNEKLQEKVMAVLKCAMQHPVTNLKLEWTLPSGCTVINIPEQIPPVFEGGKLIAYALVQGAENLTEGGPTSVVLTGDIEKQNNLQHSMTFDLITNIFYDETFPVHRLAAKTQIKEFETHTTDDDSKKGEITMMSISANVVSRYTGFVGVDKETKELVDGHQLTDRHQLTDMGLLSRYCCSASTSLHLKRYSLDSSPTTVAPKSQKAARRSKGSSVLSFFSKFRKSKASGVARTSKTNAAASNIFSMDCEDSSKNADSINDDQGSELMRLINLQNYDGSWTLNQDFARVFGISLDVLKSKNIDNLEHNIWATALSVACLRQNHRHEKTLWEMIEKKALAWLSSQKVGDRTVAELVTIAMETLTSAP
ncbi:von Willebrand factor A domain-containing protein 5A-like [Ylistrum balloti]|uniref:von Willebrand factor A domain-containing protein 5A-like n=1 Tax=Ylistrum balloti TaxID=509963 RepID=UPI002905D419|nr:von Willebrand factor A domain-containing protein 5A-like [Ylistrum balloti]